MLLRSLTILPPVSFLPPRNKSRALASAHDLAVGMDPDETAMNEHIRTTGGTLFAEALSFALSRIMSRQAAQAETKELIRAAGDTGKPLKEIAEDRHPTLDTAGVFDPRLQLGEAPAEAHRFADLAREQAK